MSFNVIFKLHIPFLLHLVHSPRRKSYPSTSWWPELSHRGSSEAKGMLRRPTGGGWDAKHGCCSRERLSKANNK